MKVPDVNFVDFKLYQGNCLEVLKQIPSESVQCCITSPPYYGLRDYGTDEQIGLEDEPQEYIKKLVDVFREIKRILKNDGTLWVNIGDSYSGSGKGRKADGTMCDMTNSPISSKNKGQTGGLLKGGIVPDGLKPKDLIGIPWMLAFALRNDGWYLRQDIIWEKPNPMPESVKDRCTKNHEYIFLLSKRRDYFFDYESIMEDAITEPTMRDKNAEGYQADFVGGDRFSPGERIYGANGKRNKRDVWTVGVAHNRYTHFATFPEKLIEPCILAGTRKGDTVIDCFSGSGTTGVVAVKNQRNYIGIDLNADYNKIAEQRIKNEAQFGFLF